eukprot:2126323-Rhodomonas_salina.1
MPRPGTCAVRARFKAFLPTLSVSGVAQEGQTITASVSFPSMPPGLYPPPQMVPFVSASQV